MNTIRVIVFAVSCLFASTNRPSDSLTLIELSDQEAKHMHCQAEQWVAQHAFSAEQASVLLNFFYQNYLFSQYDMVVRKLINLAERICRNVQDEPEPSCADKLVIHLSNIFARTQHFSQLRTNHYLTWKQIDEYMQTSDQLETTQSSLQDHADQVLQFYLKQRMPALDEQLMQDKEDLIKSSQTITLLSRTVNALIEQPELFSRDPDLIALGKLNSLFGLTQSLGKNAEQLLAIKHAYSQSAYDAQNIIAAFFYACYQELYQHQLKEDPGTHLCLLFDMQGIIEEPNKPLPSTINATSS